MFPFMTLIWTQTVNKSVYRLRFHGLPVKPNLQRAQYQPGESFLTLQISVKVSKRVLLYKRRTVFIVKWNIGPAHYAERLR